MSNQALAFTKEQLQRTDMLPPVYKEALERAIRDCLSQDDNEEALSANHFRAEVVACESESAPRDDDKLEDDAYYLQAVWFLAGWQARQRMEVQGENIIKTTS